MRLQDEPKLQAFLQTQQAATIAVPIDRQGSIHVASLLYIHDEPPLRFFFVMGRNTEKCRLLRELDAIPCACVVGTVKDVDFTLQMRGELTIADPNSHKKIVEKYYQKRGNRHDDINDPSTVLLEFAPNWARFTDYSKNYLQIKLELT